MKKLIPFALAGLFFLSGCGTKEWTETRTELSNLMHGNGTVIEKVYNPKEEKGKRKVIILKTRDNLENILKGNGTKDSIIKSEIITLNERYSIILDWEFGSFVIQGSEKEYEKLFNKLKNNQKVDILYEEEYQCNYKYLNYGKRKILLDKKLVDYEFFDIKPLK